MSKEELIESGLLEQYVLGLTSEEENKIVEDGLNAFPELIEYLDSIEKAMDSIAIQNAIVPPKKSLREFKGNGGFFSDQKPIWQSWITYALMGLALIFGVSAYSYHKGYCHIKEQKDKLKSSYKALKKDCKNRTQGFDQKEQLLSLYENKGLLPLSLFSPDTSNMSDEVIVFWSADKEAAYLYCKSLPKIDENHCFQLWGGIDEKMVSMGIFSSNDYIVPVRVLKGISSLNITIESKGGSTNPNINNLILYSKV